MNPLTIFSIFMGGMMLFIIVGAVLGLFRRKGTRLKTRRMYTVVIFVFYTVMAACMTEGQLSQMTQGLLMGLVLAIPFWLFAKWMMDRSLHGATYVYKRKNRYIAAAGMGVFTFLVSMVMPRVPFNPKPLILAIGFAGLVSELLALSRIHHLEKQLGSPILEDEI